ncbi:MAG TPA: hypothetical protein VN667_17515 [Burkholderiales bacterium]|nr:hypothetical protein [Burkholderiales bacterium]
MKLQTKILVTGMKRSKGTLENGNAYDSTKLYAMTDLDDRKGNGMGQATVEYGFGTSDEYEKFKHLAHLFPIECEAELEIITNGRTQSTVITAIKPVAKSAQGK